MQLNLRALLRFLRDRLAPWTPLLVALLPAQRAAATTLPEERGDTLYHLYDGGGQTVQGPALLVRKNFAERVSVSAGYYVDRISGASIDVVTNASPYHETRKEASVGADLIDRDTMLSVSYIDSDEHDYKARTYQVAVAQDLFDNRTTVALSYSRGDDDVGRVHTNLDEKAHSASYGLSVTQVINPTLIGAVGFEVTADDGYLQNPYRAARVQGGAVPEIYPRTRTGQALSARLVKSWTTAWSTRAELRYYTDTWKIDSIDLTLGASYRLPRNWIVDGSYRFYAQGAASFYSDDFDQPLNFMARDKELAHFSGHTLGAKLSIPLFEQDHGAVNGIDFHVAAYYLRFDYDDFTDLRDGKKYGFNATVAQAFFTFRY